MPWPLVKFNIYNKVFFALLLLCSVNPTTIALDEKRLWLPTRYQTLFLKLKEAAFAAEAIDRCVTVLRGTLDVEQSTPDHPMYRILCRDPDNRSYTEMVDGLTMETLTTPKVVEVEPTPEELERQRLMEEARKAAEEAQRKATFWEICQGRILSRTSLMLNLTWLTEGRPEPNPWSEEEAVFTVDFDAENMWGKPLNYRAICTIRSPEDVDLKVKKRR